MNPMDKTPASKLPFGSDFGMHSVKTASDSIPDSEFRIPNSIVSAWLSASGRVAFEQFRQREIVHAYLISGAKGLGKATFAKVLACALFCLEEKGNPCGVCTGCRSVLNDQNPDVLFIQPEGTRQIGVDKVREVINTISQHAFGTGHRVVIIEPVEKMTPQAQNCLLKSLEDPISNVVFLLLAHEVSALLGTIASRCARVKLTPWPDEAMRPVLAKHGYTTADIRRILPVASGNIGHALDMLQDQQGGETQAFLKKALSVKSDADVVSISTSLKEDRGGAERYLQALEQAIHQALLVRTGQLSEVALADFPHEWQKGALSAPVEGLTGLLKAVFEARKLRAGQVNWQSNIDHLMMKILEERRKWRRLLA